MLLALLTVVGWSISLRFILPFHTSSQPQDSTTHDKYIQKLLHETSTLLREITETNITEKTRQQLEAGRRAINADIEHLESKLSGIERKYADCVLESQQIQKKLETCEKQASFRPFTDRAAGQLADHISTPLFPNLSSNPTASSSSGYWLIIGIPTVSRRHNEDYLLQCLQTLSDQLPSDPSAQHYNRVLIVLVNMEGSSHKRFYEAELIYSTKQQHPKSHYFRFITVEPSQHLPDPKQGTNEANDQGNANVPGFRVRRQTRSIATVIHQVLKLTNSTGLSSSNVASDSSSSNSISPNTHNNRISPHSYYLFLEDDMLLCPSGFIAAEYLLNKASQYHPDWLAIRASYGMNGIFMRYKDLGVFGEYLLANQHRRPPDHLVVEWLVNNVVYSEGMNY